MGRYRNLCALASAICFISGWHQAAGAQPGKVLRIGVVGQISGTHPNIAESGNTLALSGLAARGLTYFDGNVSMACLLCETLPTVENGLVRDDVDDAGKPGQRVTFRLRPGLKWDDGAAITAADFVRAWRVGREPENGYAWQSRLAEEIWAASAIDEWTFEVRRRGRSCIPADFRFMPVRGDGEGGAGARDPKAYRARSLHMTSPVARGLYVGPYRVAAYRSDPADQGITLERNPHWSGVRPRFDRIELIYRPTPQDMQQAVVEGRVDLVTDTRPAIAGAGVQFAPDRFVDVQRPGRTLMQVALNLDDPALSDPRVRRALFLALDRSALAGLVSGKAAPAWSFVSENFPAYSKSLAEGGAASAAAGLLDASGWRAGADGVRRDSSGRPLAFRLAVARALLDGPLVGAIVESWRGVGVRVDVEPWGGIAHLTGASPPPMALFGYTIEGGANIDFHIFASHAIPKPGEVRNGLNIFRYRSTAVDGLVGQLRDECAPGRLIPALQELQRHIAQDLPLLPLFFMPEAHLLPRGFVVPDAGRVQLLLTQEIEGWQMRD